MTSTYQAPDIATNEHSQDTPAATSADATERAEIPAFRFPFSPQTYASKNGTEKPWYQHNNKCNHEQRPGMAPRGTRRSMGKR